MKLLKRESPSPYPERVVQFGGGNFLRAFVDWMIDILNEQSNFGGSVVIVKPTEGGSYDDLLKQGGLFHVRLRGFQSGEAVESTRLVTCVNRVVNPYKNFADYLSLAEGPHLRFIVSNTTEAGITFAPDDRLSDAPPSSFPAKLTRFLLHRYQHFDGDPARGFIILPCELIEKNGETLCEIVLQYADLWRLDEGFIQWIKNANTFCNTLVDRIVSGFPGEAAFDEIGCVDRLLVDGELFHSWVIDGDIAREFPAQQAGLNVKFTDDLSPDRDMKVRILNGAHIAMSLVGHLLGCETVRDVMEHPQGGPFVTGLIDAEILPFVDMPPDERTRFAADTLDRFRNPYLHHRLLSITLNALSKFRVRLMPTFDDYLSQHGEPPAHIVLAMAALIRFYKGGDIPLNDDPALIDTFARLWAEQDIPALVTSVLTMDSLWGRDLTQVDGLAARICGHLQDEVWHV
jgi:tagaturonate reductase